MSKTILKNNMDNMTLGQIKQLLQEDTGKGITELTDKYISILKVNKRRETTIQNIRVFLDRWVLWCTAHKIENINQVDRETTANYYDYLLENMAESSAIQNYNYLKAMCNVAKDEEYIIKNPFNYTLSHELKVVDKFWTPEYFNKLITGIRRHQANTRTPFDTKQNRDLRFKRELITRLIYTTGVRVGILCKVKKTDIRFLDSSTVMINTERKTKSRTEVQTHIFYLKNKKAIAMLKEHIKNTKGNELFVKKEYYTYRDTMYKICKKEGLEWLSPHKAKHGFITHLAEKGVSAEKICSLTGNTNVELIRKIYTHFIVKNVAEETAHLLEDL